MRSAFNRSQTDYTGAMNRPLILLIATMLFGCLAPDRPDVDPYLSDSGFPYNSGSSSSRDQGTTISDVGVGESALFDRSFAFSSTATDPGRVQAYEISDNVGTFQIDGETYPAAVYERQPFGEYILFQTLVAGADRWWVAWFYCRGDVMEGIYSEGTEQSPLLWQPFANAMCDAETRSTTAEVRMPTPELSPQPIVSTYSVTGLDVTINTNGLGQTTVNGIDYELTVFEHVDCTIECGMPGWYELHAILESETQTCFGIFYLNQNPVQLTYARCLPGFDNPIGTVAFGDAIWNG